MKKKIAESGCCEYEITFKDRTQKHLNADFSFIAYFPQLEMLLFECGHAGDCLFDLNNSNSAVIGNPYYHSISPVFSESGNAFNIETGASNIGKINFSRDYGGPGFSVWLYQAKNMNNTDIILIEATADELCHRE